MSELNRDQIQQIIDAAVDKALSCRLAETGCVLSKKQVETIHWMTDMFKHEENRSAVYGIVSVGRQMAKIISYALAGGLLYVLYYALSKFGIFKGV